jgi:hypothetical protein
MQLLVNSFTTTSCSVTYTLTQEDPGEPSVPIGSAGTSLFTFDATTRKITILEQSGSSNVGTHYIVMEGSVDKGTDVKSVTIKVIVQS